MKTEITAQQASFFSKNGYIELEGIHFQSEKIFSSTRKALSHRLKTTSEKLSRTPSNELYRQGRDLWRSDNELKSFLFQKIFPLVADLEDKRSLRIACDQWIPHDYAWDKPCSLKDLFSIQGILAGALICATESKVPVKASLGLLPLPSNPQSVLFFKSHILLNWPQLLQATDIYLVAYCLPNAVYIQNPADPCTNDLKQFGYGFGDPLRNEFHPLISS